MCCSFHSILWGGMQCSPSAISRNSSLNGSGNYVFCSELVAVPKTSCHGAYDIRCTYAAMECIRTVQQYATYYRHLHTNTLDYETNRIISEIVTWRVPLLRSIAAACFLKLFFAGARVCCSLTAMLFASLLQSARHPLISIEDVDGVIVVLNRRPVADCAAFSIHAVEVRGTFEEQALQQVSKLATAVPTV